MYRGDKIRAAMGALDLNDSALAEKTGLTRQSISAIKRERVKDVRLSSLQAIAQALGLRLQDLFEDRVA